MAATVPSPASSPLPGESNRLIGKTADMDSAQSAKVRVSSPLSADMSGTGANPLSRKLDKVLSMRLDQDKEVLEALYALSDFYTENTIVSRRNLRTEVEKRMLGVSHEFLDSFTLVKQRLDDVQAEVDAMAASCAQMKDRLQSARAQTAGVVDRTNELQARAQKLAIWAEVANAFVHRFQLSPEQMAALRGSPSDACKSRSQSRSGEGEIDDDTAKEPQVPLDDTFFEALARAKQIHKDCQLLVSTNHQMIGLEIMDQMAQLQDAAYQRMYRWALQECRVLSKGVMDVPITLRRALHALRDRPELFRYCYDEVSATRKAAVSREFIDALAIGGPGGFPRPIEMHSHDPIRYASDMLAWLHQCVAAEQELLINLVTLPKQNAPVRRYRTNLRQPIERRFSRTANDPGASEPSQESSEEEERQALDEAKAALSGIMDGTCRPFKTRLDQVLASDPGVVICFQLFNLLKFYCDTIGSHLSPDAALTATLNEGRRTCFKVFMNVLHGHGQKLLAEASKPPPADLSPSLGHMQTLTLLKDIVASYSASMASPNAEIEAGEDGMSISHVLDALLDPLLQAAQLTCASLSTANRAVHMLNCLTSIQSTMGLYEWAADKFARLESQLDENLSDLVHAQTSYTLSRTGLAEKLAILSKVHTEHITTPLSEVTGMSPSSIRDTMQEFDNFLSMSTNRLAMPQCDLLSSARLRKKVRQQAVELIGGAYASLYSAVLDPNNDYPNPTEIVPRTPEQVKSLLA